jgi:crotonobetainyl-CoA:carnitine CoA-transferase CaiB-like acyl-CoA transferase
MSRTPLRLERAGPLLGEHSREILAEHGLDAAEIEALEGEGTVVAPALAD